MGNLEKSFWNVVSMVTVPVGTLNLTSVVPDWWGIVLIIVGIGSQIAKYMREE